MTSELRPAVEVWRKAVYDYGGASIEGVEAEYRAAAVIEADRAAIIAAKDAEIAALKEQLAQQAEDNADLPTIAYFAGAADARDRLAALQAHADALAVELQQIEVDAMEHYNDWMEHGCEKAEATRFVFDLGDYARQALRTYKEFRR